MLSRENSQDIQTLAACKVGTDSRNAENASIRTRIHTFTTSLATCTTFADFRVRMARMHPQHLFGSIPRLLAPSPSQTRSPAWQGLCCAANTIGADLIPVHTFYERSLPGTSAGRLDTSLDLPHHSQEHRPCNRHHTSQRIDCLLILTAGAHPRWTQRPSSSQRCAWLSVNAATFSGRHSC